MFEQIHQATVAAIKDVFNLEVQLDLTRPDEQFGDYTTNAALQLAKQLAKNPHQLAEELRPGLQEHLKKWVSEVSIAGPGFLNLRLTNEALLVAAGQAAAYRSRAFQDKVVVAEYSDPNPFKVLHAGHLYTSVVGDAIANLLEKAGAKVHRVNFGGDVGLHVAKAMWAILNELGGEKPEKLTAIPEKSRAEWLATCYVAGTQVYEDDKLATQKIIELNKRVYQILAEDDRSSALAHIYWTCRQWSYDYFDEFYANIGSSFEKYYPESQVVEVGLATVREQLKNGVFEQSEGAVVFRGEPYGLHTRVFINSAGLPTYEAKDVGLIMAKWQDYHFDTSVIITGNDIVEYMKVVLKSIEQFMPQLAQATVHLTHGIVKLKDSGKMSSRKGNILRATELLEAAAKAGHELNGQTNPQATLGAVKYAFLKNRIGGDIVYDPIESVSISGNSGPYLQYAHARARSILNKHSGIPHVPTGELQPAERSLVRKISEYPEVIDRAVAELMPHHLATYLYELAQNFNNFYEHYRIIGDQRQAVRVQCVESFADVLRAGLDLLNIPAPEHL